MSSVIINQHLMKKAALITLGLSASFTTTTTAGDYQIMPTNTVVEQFGSTSQLMYDGANQCVRIGANVNTVTVSGSVYYSTGQQADDIVYSSIVLNNKVVTANLSGLKGNYETKLMSKTIKVKEGDLIYLGAINKSRTGQIISSLASYTWLQVEVKN